MATPSINVQNLTKNYGSVLAVDDISFQVQPGELVGFLGPNGAGKSTTMRILTTFLPASKGFAWVSGFDVMYQSMEVRQRIGYLPESAPAYPEMTVEEFLGFIAEVRGFRAADAKRAQVDRAINLTHLAPVRKQSIETLSKGFKQRVGFAQALLHDPGVLVLDEPTDGLDPNQKNEVRSLIKNMASAKAVILSTHILEEVDAICNRVIIISRGKVVADETPERLRARQPGARLDEIFRTLTHGDI